MDTYYPLEVKICSKNGWSTPQEVPGIWGVPYARTGVTIHWWGDGTGADNHDNIVNYFLGQANAGIKSVNPNPAPDPTPAPTVVITNSVLPKPVMYRFNKNANLWNYNSATWGGFTAVKSFNQGDLFTVYAIADNHNVNAKYGVTEYSYTKNITNGVNMVDLDLVTEPTQPIPTPPVEQNPTPTPDPGTVVTPEPGATGPTGSVDAPTGPTDAPSGPTGPTIPQPVDTNWKALIAAVIAAIAAVIAAVGAWIK
jgi:hypothetical protein